MPEHASPAPALSGTLPGSVLAVRPYSARAERDPNLRSTAQRRPYSAGFGLTSRRAGLREFTPVQALLFQRACVREALVLVSLGKW